MKGKMFYGWWVVGAALVMLGMTWTLPISFFGLFIKPITAELGFDRASLSMCSMIVSLTAVFMSPYVGKSLQNKSARLVVGSSVLLIIAGFLGFSISTSLPMFYACAFLIGLGINGGAIMAVSIIIRNWFIEKRGLAISIALAGTGLGGLVLSPVVNMLILNYGWRFAYRSLALLLLVVVIPLVLFVIKKTPEEMGLQPYGFGKEQAAGGQAAASGVEMPVAELKGHSFFWIYMLSIWGIGFAGGAVLLQAPPYLMDIGHSPTTVAAAVATYLGIATVGKIVLGSVYDAKGSNAGIWFGSGLMLLCIVALLFAANNTLLWTFVILHGFGTCCGTVTPPVLTSRIFGAKYYGETYGYANLFLQFGLALSSPTVAFVFDKTGTYKLAWIACAVIMGLTIFGMMYTGSAMKGLQKKTA